MSKTFTLSDAQHEHIITAIEGAIEELEEMETTHDWFSSVTPERLQDALDIIRVTTDE